MRISDWSSDVCSSDLKLSSRGLMMASIELPHQWAPRSYQRPLWNYLERGGKRAVEIAHRRWGKDDLILHRSEEHTSELQSLMRTSYAVFCLKKNKTTKHVSS